VVPTLYAMMYKIKKPGDAGQAVADEPLAQPAKP